MKDATKEGQERQVVELEVEDVGPALRYATAKITKIAREGGNSFGGNTSAPATSLWCLVQFPVTRLARIFPRSEMYLRNKLMSL